MLINEVCKECNLTKKAVEYYTEQGLIQPRITENGYRQFSETDALKLKRIAVLRGLGFSVPEIRTILENDSRTAIYDVLNRKEFEIVELQTKQALIKQLAESGDWEHIEGQVEALQNKQSILNRILDKFPDFYGKFVCLHFAPFLSEAITTDEQREAFETKRSETSYFCSSVRLLLLRCNLAKMRSLTGCLLASPGRNKSSNNSAIDLLTETDFILEVSSKSSYTRTASKILK